MKKSLLLILAVLLLLFSVSAVETTIKPEYKPGETLIASIEGNFLGSIEAEDILFYSGRAYIPMVYDLVKIQEKYYLYSILPFEERNYSLIIKNAHYSELGKEITKDLEFNFSVSGNPSLFTVNPGFILADKDFIIKVKSNIKTINLRTEFMNFSKEVPIPVGIENQLSFSVSNIKEFQLVNLTLEAEDTTYKVPIAVFPSGEEVKTSKTLRFSKSHFYFTVLENKDFHFPITIINTGQEDIENISLSSEIKIIKFQQLIPILKAGDSKEISLIINSSKSGLVEAPLIVTSEKNSYEILLSITTTKNESEFGEFINDSGVVEKYSCSDLKGLQCKEAEECKGTINESTDGSCCIGSCEGKSSWSTGKTLSLLIIFIVVVILAIFIVKKLKSRNSKDIIKSREKEYEERFQSRETKNRLSRF